jgi:acyl-CoA thioesterase
VSAHARVTPTPADRAARTVVDRMMEADEFSRWLGIEVVDAGVKRAKVRLTVRPEMMNGFGVGHGGVVYSLADSAFAFAVNSGGEITVAVDCTVSYPAAVKAGDVLTAIATEQTSTRRLAFCEVTVRNQEDMVVGHFRGTAYRTLKPLLADQ